MSDLGLPGTGIRRAGYYDERVLPTFVSVQFRRTTLKDLVHAPRIDNP